MKARKTFFTKIIAAVILASALLAPVSADTDTNLNVVDGYVYLEEDAPASLEMEETQTASLEMSEALAGEILRLTNQERAEHGLSPLARHQALESAAAEHSHEIRELNYFSHTSPTAGKATPRQRVNQHGINPQMVAENIFECSGYDIESTARLTVEAFMESPGHRKNVLNPSATHIGVGFVATNGTVSVTQVFGAGL